MTERSAQALGQGITIRLCTEKDLAMIMDMQDRVAAQFGDERVFALTPESDMAESLRLDVCFAAFSGGAPAAFAAMVLNRVSPRNLGTYLGYGEERLRRCVTYDTTFVLPEFRGLGLQRLLSREKETAALAAGAEEALTTVSPDNPVSLANVKADGFGIVAEKMMYTGVRRYILRKVFISARGKGASHGTGNIP